ncbi:MAG: stress protein family protein [Alphaproteobacteria bacterium CG_4_9_14_3_um_filter_47_13]|nr:MAG: stress protein family protein [Alphaproteobacteria bacterium CG_4_9_14_3_um_filter_47_13]
MSDMDNDDLKKFEVEEDRVKPIDVGESRIKGGGNPLPPIPDAIPSDISPISMSPEKERSSFLQPPPDDISEDEMDLVHKGEYADLTEKVPGLKKIMIGAGWDQRSLEGDPVDVDLSIFLLDRNEMTRIDEDFVFFNNEIACDGAIQHRGDSRSGAGDGDDESILLDLNGISFDVLKIVLVLSIYDPEITGQHFGMIKNIYIRFINKEDNKEIVRYKMNPDDYKGGNGMIIGMLIREGVRWIFEATAELSNGGLAKLATEYGIIVKELQSTGDDQLGDI